MTIAIDNLTVTFGGVRALDRLDAELSAPIVGLIGPNGAGKTTLLDVLSGFIAPVAGRVMLDGVDLLALSPVGRVAIGVRRTFQQEQVVGDLTLWENVQAIADHVCRGRGRAAADIERAIAFVGIERNKHMLGRHANLFERRMVEIAKTLVGRPRIILVDEPGAGLNDAETDRLRRLLLSIPGEFGAQLVLIDHDADLIASVCVDTLVLDFGRRLALGPTRAVLDDPAVRTAYLGVA
jgi:branched-chain amino acid transport system ATP-binding protein